MAVVVTDRRCDGRARRRSGVHHHAVQGANGGGRRMVLLAASSRAVGDDHRGNGDALAVFQTVARRALVRSLGDAGITCAAFRCHLVCAAKSFRVDV